MVKVNLLNTLLDIQKRHRGDVFGAAIDALWTGSIANLIARDSRIPDGTTVSDVMEAIATEVLHYVPGAETWFDATIAPNLREELGIWSEAEFDKAKKAMSALNQKIIDLSTELDSMDRGDQDELPDRNTLAVASGTASQDQVKTRNKVKAERAKKEAAYKDKVDDLKAAQQELQDKSNAYDQATTDAANFEKHKYKNWINS